MKKRVVAVLLCGAMGFPNMSVDFGPGSVASYLGSDIEFRDDTIWFTECVE